MARLNISIRSAPILIAPAGIWLEAVDLEGFDVPGRAAPGGVYDPSFHNVTFVWTVKGAPLQPYTAPGNMLPEWRDANRAYGKITALFFPEPGTYTITLRASDRSGTTAQEVKEITVLSADGAYPGAATICVSSDPDETWAGAPAGAQHVKGQRGLEAALKKAALPARLLFRRGLEYHGISLRINRQRLAHIDAWGTGARPVLRPADGSDATMFALWNRALQDQFTVANIAFRGTWDAATETGGDTSSPLTWAQSKTSCHYAVWNCLFDGFERLHFAPSDGLPCQVLIGNCVVTNWRNYGFLFGSDETRFALVGTQVAQHPEALHGDKKVGSLSNNHGPLRISDCAEVYIGASDFFSRTGWSGLSGELADQPCLRLNSSGTRGRSFNLDRVLCEGGAQVISLGTANQRIEENPGNYLIDKAVLLATAKTIGPFVNVEFGGVTLRNVLGVLPDAPRRHSNRWPSAIRARMDNPGPDNSTVPISVYSSTFLTLLADENRLRWPWQLEEGTEVFQNVTVENNLMLAQKDRLVREASLRGITPRFRGVRYNYSHQTGKLSRPVHRGEHFIVRYSEITEALVDQPEKGAATSQAYWAALADHDNWHMLAIEKVRPTLYAGRGDFSVRFEATEVIITNRGEKPWPAGANWTLSLDRTSRLAPMQTRYASPERLPLPRLAEPSQAQGGFVAEDDLFLRTRASTPSRGAIEPL